MGKNDLLKEKAATFSSLLQEAEHTDPWIGTVLEELEPLFAGIADGSVVPPLPFRTYRPKFRTEDARYGMKSAIFSAESEFSSALEDWPSRSWYGPT